MSIRSSSASLSSAVSLMEFPACPYNPEEKRLRIAIACRDFKYVILWVVVSAMAWELFLFPRSKRNTRIE
ncbi:hypothetical protein ACFX13_032465 [Malus domestica]